MNPNRRIRTFLMASLIALPALSQAQINDVPDSDGDGVADTVDAFPNDASEVADTDGDGVGNNADTDDDGDGFADVDDDFPTDFAEYRDVDGDGIGDNADPDDDNDGLNDDVDPFALNLGQQDEDLYNVFNAMVNDESLRIGDDALTLLDPDTLYWNGVEAVEVYFVNEGAGYRNQLLYTANDGTMEIIFNDVSSAESLVASGGEDALDLGDGLSLGAFDGPTQLDFYIYADGYNGGVSIPEGAESIYGANSAYNPDALEHVIAFAYTDQQTGEDWVMIGFEDLYGLHYDDGGTSDRDFNDVVIAVRGIQGTTSSWTICDTDAGEWIQVSDPDELQQHLLNGAHFPESGDCGTNPPSDPTGSDDLADPTEPTDTTDPVDTLVGGPGDAAGPGESTGVLDITVCDSRSDETGRQIAISSAGALITRSYIHCND